MKVHEKINAYIVANGINPDVLSDGIGISKARLGSMLSGEETLYAKDLKAICLALNVSPEKFIDIQGGNKND